MKEQVAGKIDMERFVAETRRCEERKKVIAPARHISCFFGQFSRCCGLRILSRRELPCRQLGDPASKRITKLVDKDDAPVIQQGNGDRSSGMLRDFPHRLPEGYSTVSTMRSKTRPV